MHLAYRNLLFIGIIFIYLAFSGCDTFYNPTVDSEFKDTVTLVLEDTTGHQISCQLQPGANLLQRRKGVIFSKIEVFRGEKLILVFDKKEIWELLSKVDDKVNLAWVLNENGLKLVSKGGRVVGEINRNARPGTVKE